MVVRLQNKISIAAACIIVFVSGVQLFCMGVIGQYLSKTYLEVKNRPIYIIKETEKNYQERE